MTSWMAEIPCGPDFCPLGDSHAVPFRSLVFGDCSGLRIKLADRRSGVAGVPDVAVSIFLQAMRSGVRRLERKFPDFPCLRIDPAKHIGQLARVPECAVVCR